MFEAMVDAWRAQMVPRGRTTVIIENLSRLVRRLPQVAGGVPVALDLGRYRRFPGLAPHG